MAVHTPGTTMTVQPHQDHTLAVEKPMCCAHCKKDISLGSVAVLTDRAGTDVAWHPECFVCNNCEELLVDLIYFFYEGKVFCGRHYAEKMKIPRCYACDELIFVQEYTMADGKSYHVNHFCCMNCDKELAGNSFLIFNDQAMCLDCYNTQHSEVCQACKKNILATEVGVGTTSDQRWHATPECFKCYMCGICLVGKNISVKTGHLMCSSKCINEFYALQ